MLKLHRREHRNKTDHWSKIILSYRHSLSFSELFETWFPLDWLIRYWNYNKLEIFPYKLLTLRIIENFVSIIRFKGVQRSSFSHSSPLLKKITIFAEYTRKRKRSPSLDYIDISSSRSRGALILWIIGNRWKIEADPGEYPWNDFARSFYLVPRLAEFGTRPHGWQIVHTSAQVPPQWPN